MLKVYWVILVAVTMFINTSLEDFCQIHLFITFCTYTMYLYVHLIRAEDLHQCTGVHAAVLATEGSVEFASWPRTLPRKDRVVQEEVKEVWPKHEKKEFNLQRNLIFRAKKVEVESVPRLNEEGNEDSKDCIDENEKEIECSSGVISGLTCTNHSDNQDINSSVVDTNTTQITKATIKQPCNSIRNNDTSGGITAENIPEVDGTWGAMVSALDPFRDVILFPSEHAMCASMFKWECSDRIIELEGNDSVKLVHGYSEKLGDGQNNSVEKGVSNSSGTGDNNIHPHRWRLVVLEASWQHGKTMYRQVRVESSALLTSHAITKQPSALYAAHTCTCYLLYSLISYICQMSAIDLVTEMRSNPPNRTLFFFNFYSTRASLPACPPARSCIVYLTLFSSPSPNPLPFPSFPFPSLPYFSAPQLTTYRALKGLPPLRSVIITGVTGEYWKFHEEGTSLTHPFVLLFLSNYLSGLTLSHPILSSHLISSHLISSHLISSHLISPLLFAGLFMSSTLK